MRMGNGKTDRNGKKDLFQVEHKIWLEKVGE